MKREKFHENAVVIIFSITVSIIILFGSINSMIFNKEFYYREYSKNNIATNVPETVDVKDVINNVLKYFKNNAELEYFNEEEQNHMDDVKRLIHIMQITYYTASALALGLFYYCYRRFKHDKYHFIKILSNILIYSSIGVAAFMIIMFLISVFNFKTLFYIFHLIFFPQGNWMFDSSSLLINVFPEQFFFDISLRIFIYAMFQAIVFFGIGYWMRRQLKIVEKHNPFR